MSYTVNYNCQGQAKFPQVSETGDEFSFTTTVAAGATEVSNIGVIPDNLVEVIVDTDVAITIDCGTNSPTTLAAGAVLVWSTGCGLTAPFAGASLASFTIVSTEGSDSGEVRVMGKTANS